MSFIESYAIGSSNFTHSTDFVRLLRASQILEQDAVYGTDF